MGNVKLQNMKATYQKLLEASEEKATGRGRTSLPVSLRKGRRWLNSEPLAAIVTYAKAIATGAEDMVTGANETLVLAVTVTVAVTAAVHINALSPNPPSVCPYRIYVTVAVTAAVTLATLTVTAILTVPDHDCDCDCH